MVHKHSKRVYVSNQRPPKKLGYIYHDQVMSHPVEILPIRVNATQKLAYIYFNTSDYSWIPYQYQPNSIYSPWQTLMLNNWEVMKANQSSVSKKK